MARDIHFGDQECFFNETFKDRKDDNNCTAVKDEADCKARDFCVWSYSGFGYEYQVRILITKLLSRLGNSGV